MVISEITTGDHSNRTDGRQRARLRAAQRVLAIAVAHHLSLQPARQVEIARERLARIERALRRLALAFRPTCIVAWIVAVFIAIRLARVAWTAAEYSRVVVIAIA